ncbi:MAG TPA: DUF4124 domain-containing protein [Ramlibacter sp.]|nr:DUF4124 domain-containing protein [Ramlibacter sp.]
MRGWLGCVIAAGLWSALSALSNDVRAEGIYTCIDAKGHRLTSDRPIIDCIDREQTELSPTGQVVRRIGPSLTAAERAAQDEKARRAAEERSREVEEKRRDRVLLARYPDKLTHDKERNQALAAVDDVIRSALQRIDELHADRKKLDTELEFYSKDPAKVPLQLKHRLADNEQELAAQQRFVANQDDEKKRINAKYDKELVRLRSIWATRSSSSAAR